MMRALLDEEAKQVFFLERRAAIVALELVAALGAQQVELVLRLHSFRHYRHPQAVRHRDDRASDRHVVAVVRQVANERPVDLEAGPGKTLVGTERPKSTV